MVNGTSQLGIILLVDVVVFPTIYQKCAITENNILIIEITVGVDRRKFTNRR